MNTVLSGEACDRLRLAVLVLVLAIALCSTAQAAVIYESATLGATGVTGPYATVIYDQWFGVRFQVTQPVLATKIGGHFVAGIPGSAVPARTFFGALVALTGPTDMPDTAPVFVIDIDSIKYYEWTGPDILARIDMIAPNTSADIRGDLPGGGIVLQPGYYGLIFGSLASNSRVGMVTNGTDIGTVSGFNWIAWSEISPGSPFPDDWYADPRNVGPGLTGGTRFVVEGTVACNPATYVPVPTTCGVGVCASTGQTSCVNNIVVDSCTPGTPTGTDNNCNGVDENCNGTADENYVPTATSCGVGVCARTGQNICVSGQLQNTCTPGTPGTETCNNIDDDCDGVVDDNLTRSTTCGTGTCAATGTETCTGGVWGGNTCTPGTPGVESFTQGATCGDTLDNDCDGLVDLADPGCINNPRIAVTPASKNFGVTNVGSTAHWQPFTITNTGALDLIVSSIQLVTGDIADFKVSPDTCANLTPTLTGGSSCSVSAAFIPSAPGARSTVLRITSNASNAPTADIALNGQGSLDPAFSDVPEGTLFENFINTIYYNGITAGCRLDDPSTTNINEAMYCPDDNVTRAQMAVFILRALGEQSPPACTGSVFSDVNANLQPLFCRWIERFSQLGITSGCQADNPSTPGINEAMYCPDDNVTRAQMAVFILRALGEQSPPACTGAEFNDVSTSMYPAPLGPLFCGWIERFSQLGITSGCQADNPSTPGINEAMYCVDLSVTRAQMAVFLTKAFLQ